MTKVLGHYDGRAIVLDEPLDLAVNDRVEVTVEARPRSDEPPRGSPAALLAAMSRMPRLTREDIDELERAIDEGTVPARDYGIFDETAD